MGVRYAKEIICILMMAQAIKQEINNQFMESITSKDEYQEKINYYINCFTNNDDSYIIELGIKEKIISLVNYKFGVCLNTEKINKLPLKFVEDEFRRIFNNDKVHLSVPDKYIDNALNEGSLMVSIQKDWLKLQDSKCDINNFEEFRGSCLSLMNRIDALFPFHILKFDIMNTICKTHSKIKQTNSEINEQEYNDYCCSLYSDCFTLSTLLFGTQHRQTLLIQIELSLSLFSNKKLAQYVDKLHDLLKSVQDTFGKTSFNASVVLKLLSDTYFDLGNYSKSIEFAKQNILVMDEKKRGNNINNDQYINAHLKISLIAEKIGNHQIGIRFLSKLYNHLKNQLEKLENNNKQKLWENIDIKILSISISRIKLKMSNQHKLNDILKKWKDYHSNNNNSPSIQDYTKYKQLIIQNLCLNPIKKSNDLLKNKTKTIEVVCWINIIKEFELNFLGIKQ